VVPSEVFKSVRFVVDQSGQPSAVQMDIEAWESLLDWLEDVEDRAAVKDMLERLRMGPEKAGALHWDKIKAEWDEPEAEMQQ
jgi:predicted DNA-binding protein